eukprot:10622717-Alexandrium_andersonii.AAC.1
MPAENSCKLSGRTNSGARHSERSRIPREDPDRAIRTRSKTQRSRKTTARAQPERMLMGT